MTGASMQQKDPEQDHRIKQALRVSLEDRSDQYREWRRADDARVLSGTDVEVQAAISRMGWAQPDPRRMQYIALELEKQGRVFYASALIGEVLRMSRRWTSDDTLSTEFCIRNGCAWLLCDSSIKLSDADKARIVASTMKRYTSELNREDRRPNLLYDLMAVQRFGGVEQLREFLDYCIAHQYEHLAECTKHALGMKAAGAA